MTRKEAESILAELGGRVCIKGVVLEADGAIRALMSFSHVDVESLKQDLQILDNLHEWLTW